MWHIPCVSWLITGLHIRLTWTFYCSGRYRFPLHYLRRISRAAWSATPAKIKMWAPLWARGNVILKSVPSEGAVVYALPKLTLFINRKLVKVVRWLRWWWGLVLRKAMQSFIQWKNRNFLFKIWLARKLKLHPFCIRPPLLQKMVESSLFSQPLFRKTLSRHLIV